MPKRRKQKGRRTRKRPKKGIRPLYILIIVAAVVVFGLILVSATSLWYGYADGIGTERPIQHTNLDGFCGSSTFATCDSDADCMIGGCSEQICQSLKIEPAVTTCEWTECYDREAYRVFCLCMENECQWTK